MKVIRCSRCHWIGGDGKTVPGWDVYGMAEKCCPICGKADCLTDVDAGCGFPQEELEGLWSLFGDVPVNDDDEILEDFLGFPTGTYRFEIWHWFDVRYGKGVASLCYGDACPDIQDRPEEREVAA